MDDLDKTLQDRDRVYGDYKTICFNSQKIKELIKNGKSWEKMSSLQKESLDMISNKIARIINGDPNYIDSWHDIAGYSQLVVNDLMEKNNE